MSTFTLCICVMLGLLITRDHVSCGTVRLRDGFSSTSGRVEVKAETEDDWANICSHEFDIIDADVICRQIGYAWALNVYNVNDTLGTQAAAISDLECEGDETNIFDCDHVDISTNDWCEGVPGVGIECKNLEYTDLVPFKKLRFASDAEKGGRLEIYDANWKPVCSHGWDIHDTVVACRQLGFAFAITFDVYADPGIMYDIYRDFECSDTEGYLLACEHKKEQCTEYVEIQCAAEFEEYWYDWSFVSQYSDYYPWINDDPCADVDCQNGGYCIINEYFEAECECTQEWDGEYCENPVNDNNGDGSNNDNGNPPTDPPASGSNDVGLIIYVAIGAGVFVLLIAVIVTIVVAYTMRRRTLKRSKAKTPVEIGLKGKPVVENKRNNNSYQQTQGLPRPAQNKPTTPPSTEYYLEPTSDYVAQDDYTALAPASEIYDEIPYDSIDNGGYMDLTKPSEYQPPQLPKPR